MKNKTMTFSQALEQLLLGKQVSRREWNDPATYLQIVNDQLMIYKPDDVSFHPLIISTDDIESRDWQVVGDGHER